MEYEQCEKLSSLDDERHTVRRFLEWLGENELVVCDWKNIRLDMPLPVTKPIDKIIMEFLEIDEDALEKERQHMLENL